MFKGHIVSKKEAKVGCWITLFVTGIVAGLLSEYSRISGVYQGNETGYVMGYADGYKDASDDKDPSEKVLKEAES